MKSVEAITNILNEQLNGYGRLFELLQSERLCLLDMNAQCIEEISKAKDTLILKLRLLEEERTRLMKDFSEGDVALQTIAEHTGNDELLGIRSKLISILHGIEDLNRLNGLLMERSLSYIRGNANFFGFYAINNEKAGKAVMLSGEM